MRATAGILCAIGCAVGAIGQAGCGSNGTPAVDALVDAQRVFLGDGRVIHARCLAYEMYPVPPTVGEFEAEIRAWMATCVTSRTEGAHREAALVDGNPSVAALWRGVLPGGRLTIVPHYMWSAAASSVPSSTSGRAPRAGRVERIVFWSPAVPDSRPPDVPDPDGVRVPDTPRPADVARARPGPVPDDIDDPDRIEVRRDPPVPGPGETPLRPPDDLRDMVDQARVLRDLLRREGALDDARRLSELIEELEPLVIDVAILVGTYYFATKLRAGRLLFQWGWSAAGRMFARKLARLERLLPRVERAIGKLVNEVRVIKSRHPRLAGSGLDWEVLDQIVDGSVPAQLDGFACGPACVQMVLDDRGIHVPQAKIIEQARAMHHPELKSQMTRPRELAALLRRYDPNGGWTGDWDPKSLQARTDLQILSARGRRGGFIAQVGKHFVVVDGVDATGHVLVRDPWYEPGLQRGIRAGSRYRVALEVFVELLSDAVYRR